MNASLSSVDDYLHGDRSAPDVFDARTYRFVDAGVAVGGWLRMVSDPRRRRADTEVLVRLPDGRVAFASAPADLTTRAEQDAGGLRFEVILPYVEHQVSYHGELALVPGTEPTGTTEVFGGGASTVPVRVDLRMRAIARPWSDRRPTGPGPGSPRGGTRDGGTDVETEVAAGRTEQHMSVQGSIDIGGRRVELTDAFGVRSHRWGPSSRSPELRGTWLTASFGTDVGVAVRNVADDDGHPSFEGYLYDRPRYGDARPVPIQAWELMKRGGAVADADAPSIHAEVRTADATYRLAGDVWSRVRLRPHGAGRPVGVTSTLVGWQCDGLRGVGGLEHVGPD